MYYTAKVWRILFFVGIIAINGMLPFRATAMKTGGLKQFIWSSLVIGIGAFLLWCLYQLRLHRNADKEARAARFQARAEATPPDEEAHTPKTFVPTSRKAALAHTHRHTHKKKRKKKKR